ncbi:MAG TPA: imidazoleglycerol-phosphate dehydratase HisB [Clostridiales bacterium]|nr:imidazoleglycerol-phosphate dehydratase HisB [Clostridiales bacterium]
MNRKGSEKRTTKETCVTVAIDLDGSGTAECKTGIGFLDHMLTLFSAHGGFDLQVEAKGDLEVDGHHTVEDVGIVLGKALSQALGDKKGIQRYGTIFIPMDESLVMVSLDISGRPYLHMEFPALAPMVGDFDTQLLEEFFRAFTVHSGITLHIRVLYGRNTHHMIEAAFKALGRSLRQAVNIMHNSSHIPSTKGLID